MRCLACDKGMPKNKVWYIPVVDENDKKTGACFRVAEGSDLYKKLAPEGRLPSQITVTNNE